VVRNRLPARVADLGCGASADYGSGGRKPRLCPARRSLADVENALRGLPAWNGRVLIDATNPFIEYSPKLVLADLGGKGASEVVAALASGARIVRPSIRSSPLASVKDPQRMVAAASSSSRAITRSRPNSSAT